MPRLPTIHEVLKKHNNAFFTLLNSNGEAIFEIPCITARAVREGLSKQYLGVCVSELNIEKVSGVEFITATMTWHF